MFGDIGSRRAVIIVSVEVSMGCFLYAVRHFMGVVEVFGGVVIDDIYINRM